MNITFAFHYRLSYVAFPLCSRLFVTSTLCCTVYDTLCYGAYVPDITEFMYNIYFMLRCSVEYYNVTVYGAYVTSTLCYGVYVTSALCYRVWQ